MKGSNMITLFQWTVGGIHSQTLAFKGLRRACLCLCCPWFESEEMKIQLIPSLESREQVTWPNAGRYLSCVNWIGFQAPLTCLGRISTNHDGLDSKSRWTHPNFRFLTADLHRSRHLPPGVCLLSRLPLATLIRVWLATHTRVSSAVWDAPKPHPASCCL